MDSREGARQRRILYAAALLRALAIGLSHDVLLWREFRKIRAPEEITA